MVASVPLLTWICAWGAGDYYAAERARLRERQMIAGRLQAQTPWMRLHYIGDIWYAVQIDNPFGMGHYYNYGLEEQAALGINWTPGIEFPARSRREYLAQGGVVFGCIRGNDTLVSSSPDFGEGGWEFYSFDPIVERSNVPGSAFYDPSAHAEQVYDAVYSDTFAWGPEWGTDAIEGRPHKPIGVRLHQMSHAWSQGPARHVIIIEIWATNISAEPIEQGCIGVFLIPGVSSGLGNVLMGRFTNSDDICGWINTIPAPEGFLRETLNVAWVADNDGDPIDGGFGRASIPGVLGIRVLHAPGGGHLNFNWWGTDWGKINWGPRRLRDAQGFFGSLGEPLGDRNRYKMMTNEEIDYDQVYAALDRSAQGWSAPLRNPKLAEDVARGLQDQLLLSYGPLPDIMPGDSVSFIFAVVGADDFHRDPRNFQDNFDPRNPRRFVDNLDFSGLINAARWADWVYDTPEVDTDGDGDRGRRWVFNCRVVIDPKTGVPRKVCDYIPYKGDGVPDWKAPRPMGPPSFTVTTSTNTIALRWDGATTETIKDPVSSRPTFEGYRVYTARTSLEADWSLVASWDREDFTRWVYSPTTNDWRQESHAMTVDEWRWELNDLQFDPQVYARPSFLTAWRDTVVDTTVNIEGEIVRITPRERYSYWAPEGLNQDNEYLMGEQRETNEIQRITERDTVIDEDTLTYGVYECTIENLNPSIPLFVAVTAFDRYDYRQKSGPTESAPQSNAQYAVPLPSAPLVVDSGLKVSVYPNPYKSLFRDPSGNSTNYYEQGYEAPGQPRLTERDRRIYFINLPEEATIRIFSLDGDLIREIHHPDPFLTNYSSVVGWDLISRNTQLVESGIYLWRVDSRLGSQVGKLVIIR